MVYNQANIGLFIFLPKFIYFGKKGLGLEVILPPLESISSVQVHIIHQLKKKTFL